MLLSSAEDARHLAHAHGHGVYSDDQLPIALTDGVSTKLSNDGEKLVLEDSLPLGIKCFYDKDLEIIPIEGIEVGRGLMVTIEGDFKPSSAGIDLELEFRWQEVDDTGSNTISTSRYKHIAHGAISGKDYKIMDSTPLMVTVENQSFGYVEVYVRPDGGNATFNVTSFSIFRI